MLFYSGLWLMVRHQRLAILARDITSPVTVYPRTYATTIRVVCGASVAGRNVSRVATRNLQYSGESKQKRLSQRQLQ